MPAAVLPASLQVPDVLKNRAIFRLLVAVCLAICFAGASFLALSRLHLAAPVTTHYDDLLPSCRDRGYAGSVPLWTAAQEKHAGLADDKFTVALQTYQRPIELAATLANLLDHEIPSLHEVLVIWNDLDKHPPPDFISPRGIPVRYRWSQHNSLNEKLRPDPSLATQAVFLSDDDVFYRPADLEFAFQTWRAQGRDRLVGALARCADHAADGSWKYTFCKKREGYALIITNLAFTHISFLEYYWSSDPAMAALRAYVDEHFNCEDIALNYVASLLTGSGPLLVSGMDRYASAKPAKGISRKKGHMKARSQCLSDLADVVGCMPLVNVTGYVQRGVYVIS